MTVSRRSPTECLNCHAEVSYDRATEPTMNPKDDKTNEHNAQVPRDHPQFKKARRMNHAPLATSNPAAVASRLSASRKLRHALAGRRLSRMKTTWAMMKPISHGKALSMKP